MRRTLAVVFALSFVVAVAGCSNAVPSGVNVQVGVENPFTYAQVGSAPIVLNATVKFDGSEKGVKWALTAANVGCSPACGTLAPQGKPSFSAMYTPPTGAPLNQQATISAISIADDRQQYAFTFSIIPPATVQITDKFSSVLAGAAPIQVDAAVTNDPANAGVTWTLTANGSNCSPVCGTLSTTGPNLAVVYTPPADYPSGANVNPTITATSVTNTAASDSFAFTILSSATLFKGNYTFLLRGYDGNALPMSLAGTIIADGNSNITNAELDINDDNGVNLIPAGQTGTYSVKISPTGVTHVLFEIAQNLAQNPPQVPNTLKFRCFLSSDGKRGRIIEVDGTGYINSGTIELQDPSAISASPSGNFAFGVDSDAPLAGRTIAAGQLVLGASGVTGGLIDQSVGAGPTPTFVNQPLSPDSMTTPDSLGRGTLNVTAQSQTVQYAYYVVDSSHFFLIEADQGHIFGTVFAGVGRKQASLTADSVNGVSVIQLTGFDEPTGTSTVVPVVVVGLLTVTGGNSYNLLFDINDMGVGGATPSNPNGILTRQQVNGSISFDPATGRAAVTSPSAVVLNAGAWYLYDQGKGFFVEEDISTTGLPPDQSITNRALSGSTLPQVGAPFQDANLSGNVIAGSGASSSQVIPNTELAINLVPPTGGGSTPAGDYSAGGDLTSIPSQAGNVTDFQFTGKFRLVDAATGYGGIQLPAPLFGDFTQPSGTFYQTNFYMIAPNQFIAIGTQTQVYAPGYGAGLVLYADPQ